MKVLWFSNCVLSKDSSTGSGSWLFAMRDLICNDVELLNVTEGSVNIITKNEGNGLKEYLLPCWQKHNGLPDNGNIQKIIDIINEEKPDVIHIWGVEKYWALLFSRGILNQNHVLLEMQGVVSACVDVYYGGLTPKECRQLYSLKSFLSKKYSINSSYISYQKRSVFEKEIVRSFKNIAVQSRWTEEQLSTICDKNTSFFYSLRPIRQEFYRAPKWDQPLNGSPVIFCSMSYYVPFKGLHFLIKALKILVTKYPTITLRIAGYNLSERPIYKIGDYDRFLLSEIKRLRLNNNIVFCGSLNATQIVGEILHADVVVNPSLVESYSAASAEALYLGAPTVMSFAGAMINFSDDKPVALYYHPMDYRSLATKIIELLEYSHIREELSTNAKDVLSKKCNPDVVRTRQLEIYSKICYQE